MTWNKSFFFDFGKIEYPVETFQRILRNRLGETLQFTKMMCWGDSIIYRAWYLGHMPTWAGNQMSIEEYMDYILEHNPRNAVYVKRVVQGEIMTTYKQFLLILPNRHLQFGITVNVCMDLQDRFFIVVSFDNNRDLVQDILIDQSV